MPNGPAFSPLAISQQQRTALERLASADEGADEIAKEIAWRARVILRIAEGQSVTDIESKAGVPTSSSTAWRERFTRLGIPGIRRRSAGENLV